MASTELKNIFLSASVPFKNRHEKYHESADIIAIRDAVLALASIALPRYRLIWGGHPSITPIIYYILEKFQVNIQDHVKLYQSKYFERIFPIENTKFTNVEIVDEAANLPNSLRIMRGRMLGDNNFEAGIFIGGMEGVEDEYFLFRELNPQAIILPIASTGGASKIIFENYLEEELRNKKLENDYGYMSLFQDLLINKIG